ncbi:MAG: tripartite tricarboxylate transporter substrate binding protein [Pseudomonadota bacterium]
MEKNFLRRMLFVFLVLMWGLMMVQSVALAQVTFPTKPVAIWVGFPPGGSTDTLTRVLGEAVEKSLGQKIVIINKPGAGGAVATSLLTKEKPDGYTLGSYPDTPVTRAPHLRDLDYDPFRDLSFIIRVGLYKNAFVVKADSPFKKWKDVVEWAKKNPGQLTYGNPGAGTTPHIIMAKLALVEGFTYKTVPFAGDSPNVSALLGGHVMTACGSSLSWRPHVEAKTVRVLLIVEKEGLDYAPDAPTFEKMNYDFEPPTSLIITAPQGITDPVRETLEKAFLEGIKSKTFRAVAEKNELLLREPLTGKALSDFLKKYYAEYEQLIKEAGIYKTQKK